MPDEVWNFGCGDGIEKAILMANFMSNNKSEKLYLDVENESVVLKANNLEFRFTSDKKLINRINIR